MNISLHIFALFKILNIFEKFSKKINFLFVEKANLDKIFGFLTNISVLDKLPGFGTKSLGPWTNPWVLDKT